MSLKPWKYFYFWEKVEGKLLDSSEREECSNSKQVTSVIESSKEWHFMTLMALRITWCQF